MTFLLVWSGRRAQRHEAVALKLQESCGGGGGGLGGGLEKFVGTKHCLVSAAVSPSEAESFCDSLMSEFHKNKNF